MKLSIIDALVNDGDLNTNQLIQIEKILAKIIDKGGVTVVCTDTAFITSYNCNKRGLTK
ncbi:hypothetical protein [Moraxella sp. RCAD0137]|uniref:hypothetical protein n=1 Tax=Moraxella sp. RCAD0137 TaxID=1775913 RepID=UPI001304AC4B|nr:hypothetical protein [Moraxella sp. RCAD0137]